MENIDPILAKKGMPDIVFLQQVPSEYVVKAIAARLKLPYTAFLPYRPRGGYGVAILARYTLSPPKILRQNGYASLSARMDFNGSPILLCYVHLVRIMPLPVKNEEAVVSWFEFCRILYSEIFQENQSSLDVAGLLDWLDAEGCEKVILDDQVFFVIPAKARIHALLRPSWIPGLRCASPGMTGISS